MRRETLDTAGRLLEDRIGLRLEGSTLGRLERALRDRARRRHLPPETYVGGLDADAGEVDCLVDALTVQETRFFRDPAHFTILARLVEAAPEPGVIWSAGCANGQEPWSVAMLLEERRADGWRVLATDVSRAALRRTAEGVYGEREVATLSARRRGRFLERADGGWRVVDALRDRVLARPHNLVEAPPPPEAGDCRIVLCRNVLIYLRPELVERVLAGIRARMPPGGRLFVGAGEALPRGAGGFVPERHGNSYVYRPATGDGSAAVPVPPPRVRRASAPPPRSSPPPARNTADAHLNLALARDRLRRGDAGRE